VKRRTVLAVDVTSQTSLLAPGIGAPFWTPVRDEPTAISGNDSVSIDITIN
jgi:hypothetical protein